MNYDLKVDVHFVAPATSKSELIKKVGCPLRNLQIIIYGFKSRKYEGISGLMTRIWLLAFRTKGVKQVAVLYAGTVLQLSLGVITSIILTRALKPEQYGHYSYITNLAALVLSVVSSGHFVSISMMLAQNTSERGRRSLLGTSLLLSILISCAFCTLIFVFSFFQDYLFYDKIGDSIRALSLLLFFFPIQTYLESVLMGLNHITSLSLLRVIPKTLYVVSLLVYIHFANLSFFPAFVLLLLSSYIVYGMQIFRLRPTFDKIANNLKSIKLENRMYGFHVYLGSLANVSTTYLCALSVSYFGNNEDLGYFNLALVISTPLSLLPNVIATTFFKNFANTDRIPDRIILFAIVLSIASYGMFVLFLKGVILVLYTTDYLRSISLGYILGLGMTIHGFGDIFNRFLCANAKGKEVRNGAFITGIVIVFGSILMVPSFLGAGAAVARLLGGITYFAMMFFAYRSVSNVLKNRDKKQIKEC